MVSVKASVALAPNGRATSDGAPRSSQRLRKLRRDRGHYLHFYRSVHVLASRPVWLEWRPKAGVEAIRCLVYADRYHRYTGLSKPIQKPSCARTRLTERTGYAQVTFGKEANYRASVGKAT